MRKPIESHRLKLNIAVPEIKGKITRLLEEKENN
jgi:hypothetical protein